MRGLGTLGGKMSYPLAINEHGQVVGQSETASGDEHAFLWEKGKMRDLGTLGGPNSVAVALNERGQVVGRSDTASGDEHAFLWENGKLRDLGTLGGKDSAATDINERRHVVGTADRGADEHGDPSARAFVWQKGKMRGLGVSEVIEPGQGVFINDRGQVAGSSWRRPGRSQSAFLWQDGTTTALYPLVVSTAINNQTVVSGIGRTHSTSPAHPFFWKAGEALNLGHLGRGDKGRALDVNQHGQVVGRAGMGPPGGKSHAFVWQNGRMIDLGGIRKTDWSVAVAINDRGQIIGYSRATRLDPSHAVLWTLKRG